jgi:hypothetical protein
MKGWSWPILELGRRGVSHVSSLAVPRSLGGQPGPQRVGRHGRVTRPRRNLVERGGAVGDGGLCTDEGSLSFGTAICRTYMDYQYKLECGGIMTEGPRLSRPSSS